MPSSESIRAPAQPQYGLTDLDQLCRTSADLIGNLPRRQHVFRLSDGRHFGNRIDTDGEMGRHRLCVDAESRTCNQATLLGRGGRQAWKPDYIPGGEKYVARLYDTLD